MIDRDRAAPPQGAEPATATANVVRLPQQELRLPLVSFDKIRPEFNKPWLVEGLLEPGKLSVVYGAPKEGKTFIVVDLALHLTLGSAWFGRRVTQGPVIYIAAEGGGTIIERVDAFRQYHGIEDAPPFYLLPGRFLAMDAASIAALIHDALALGASLIVLDTAARVMAGADENSQKDMGLFVDACDKLREATGAHVLVVHHAGKDAKRGARGSNVLLGAVDGEMKCAKIEDRYLLKDTNTRGRAGESSIWFNLKSVDIGQDCFGNVFDSAVVVPAEKLSERDIKRDALDADVSAHLLANGPMPLAKLKDAVGQISTGKADAERKAWDAALKRIGATVDEYKMVDFGAEGTGAESTS